MYFLAQPPKMLCHTFGLALILITPTLAATPSSQPTNAPLVDALHSAWTAPTLTPPLLAPLKGHEKEILDALSTPTPWPDPIDKMVDRWDLPGPDGKKYSAAVYVPQGYTPEKSWPLIIALPGTSEDPAHQLQFMIQVLGDSRIDKFVVVAPQYFNTNQFSGDYREVGLPAAILPALSKRLRINFDRVYLTGYSRGGHCSFISASLFSDRLAGVLPLAGTFLVTPFFEPQCRLLLPNLAGLPLCVLYGTKDTGAGGNQPSGENTGKVVQGIADTNKLVADMVSELAKKEPGLAGIRIQALPDVGHGNVRPNPEQMDAWLGAVRPSLATGDFSERHAKRFRSPSESWINGIRATKWEGPVFDPTQNIKLNAQPGEKPEVVAQRYFDDLFGLIAVQVDRKANQMKITTRKVGELEVWLTPGELNLDQPVSVVVNSQVRYKGLLSPDVTNLLHWLRLTGDTARPMVARLIIPKSGAVKINPPEEPQPLWLGGK